MLIITGYSDDLIEVEGDIRGEYDALGAGDDGTIVSVDGGVVLRITYSRTGVWRIVPIVDPPDSGLTITLAPEDDDDNYTDRAVIDRPVGWVQVGNSVSKRKPVQS